VLLPGLAGMEIRAKIGLIGSAAAFVLCYLFLKQSTSSTPPAAPASIAAKEAREVKNGQTKKVGEMEEGVKKDEDAKKDKTDKKKDKKDKDKEESKDEDEDIPQSPEVRTLLSTKKLETLI
jgi:hypothetical protein